MIYHTSEPSQLSHSLLGLMLLTERVGACSAPQAYRVLRVLIKDKSVHDMRIKITLMNIKSSYLNGILSSVRDNAGSKCT